MKTPQRSGTANAIMASEWDSMNLAREKSFTSTGAIFPEAATPYFCPESAAPTVEHPSLSVQIPPMSSLTVTAAHADLYRERPTMNKADERETTARSTWGFVPEASKVATDPAVGPPLPAKVTRQEDLPDGTVSSNLASEWTNMNKSRESWNLQDDDGTTTVPVAAKDGVSAEESGPVFSRQTALPDGTVYANLAVGWTGTKKLPESDKSASFGDRRGFSCGAK